MPRLKAKPMEQLKKLFEDEHILAVSKPRGLLTVGNKPGQKNITDELKRAYQKDSIRIRPLNRLDRGTSGIVLFAKSKECFQEAVENKKFAGVKKTYLALIKGYPKHPKGKISFPLPSRQDKRKLLPAETSYEVMKIYQLKKNLTAALVEVEINPGRFHQIRLHFQMIFHPLFMDREYMDKKDYKFAVSLTSIRDYLLHANKVSFAHFITGQPVTIEDPLPKDFKRSLQSLLK